jgi:hypothetical protein
MQFFPIWLHCKSKMYYQNCARLYWTTGPVPKSIHLLVRLGSDRSIVGSFKEQCFYGQDF